MTHGTATGYTTLRTVRKNSSAPVGSRPTRALRCEAVVSRRVKVAPCADVGNAPRPPRPFPKTPLRPSKGLLQARPLPSIPARDDRHAGTTRSHPGQDAGTRTVQEPRAKLFLVGAPQGTPCQHGRKPNRNGLPSTKPGCHERGTEGKGTRVDEPGPVTLDAERRLLGTLLAFYTPPAVENVRGTGLKPGDFYWRSHEIVYRAVVAVHEAGEHVDPVTVNAFLAARANPRGGTWLDAAGGPARTEYLAAFADANAYVTCARIVAEDARWRRWQRCLWAAGEAVAAKDDGAFWAAISHVRDDVLPGSGLRVIDGDGEKAA